MKQDPNADNSCVAVKLLRAEVERYQKTVSSTSGHQSSMPMFAFNHKE